MDSIPVREYCTAVFPIRDSQDTDVVSYKVYKVSDASILSQGNCTYVAGINWKVVFRPKTEDVFIVEVKNETLDVTFAQCFKAKEG